MSGSSPKLARTLSIAVVAPIAIGFGAFLLVNANLEARRAREQAEMECQEWARAVALGVREAVLLSPDAPEKTAGTLIERHRQASPMMNLEFLDENGKSIIAGGAGAAPGRGVDPARLKEALEARQPLSYYQDEGRWFAHLHPIEVPHGVLMVAMSMEGEYRRIRRNALSTAALGILTLLLVTAVLGVAMERVVVRPLRLVAGAVEEIGTGNLDVRLPAFSSREIGALSAGFNRMVVQRAEAAKLQRSTEEQLRQAQKLEAVGRLAAGIAHDFNNLLTTIIGYSELLQENAAEGSALRGDLETIRLAGSKAAGLTRQLLAFSRKQVLNPQVLDLNSVVAGVEKMLRRLIGEDIEVVVVPGPALGSVEADAGSIEQVIMNLVVNARDAMPDGGMLTLTTGNVEWDETHASHHEGAVPGRYVWLRIEDTGTGIDPAILPHIFEPFFTTKEVGKGTGLGLSTVYGIAKQSGGHIAVKSAPGHGTAFEIYLPRVDEVPEPERKRAGPATTLRGTETILLAEDAPPVRDLAIRALEAGGFKVIAARDGREAAEIAERDARSIDLLLTDIVMPRMNGPELASHLAALRPGTRVLYMSGYPSGSGAPEETPGNGPILPKPFSSQALLQKVRDVLDAPRLSPEES
ncbi:MAG: response regulator [Planctomycetes bacterium]|nr:response regulator [Planctomycetota bacterium]